jgi:hypothetical protein
VELAKTHKTLEKFEVGLPSKRGTETCKLFSFKNNRHFIYRDFS